MTDTFTLQQVLVDVTLLLSSPLVAGAIGIILSFVMIPRILRMLRYLLSDEPYGNRERSLQWAHEQTKQEPPAPYDDAVEMGLKDPDPERGVDDKGAGANLMYLQDETTAPLDARARITDPDATRKLPGSGISIQDLRGVLPQVTYPVDTSITFTCVACGHPLPYIPGTQGVCVCGKRYYIPTGE